MPDRQIPIDVPAEAAMLGSMLLSRSAIDEALERGHTADDFFDPRHAIIFDAIATMVGNRSEVDIVTVGHHLTETGRLEDVGGIAYLAELMNVTPAVSGTRYGRIVAGNAALRAIIEASSKIAEIGYYGSTSDVERSLAEATAVVAELARDFDRRMMSGYFDDIGLIDPGGDRDLDQPWIAKGVLRRNHRAMIVARGGIGKSTLLRQLAFCCVNGVHPYTGQRTEVPRETLIVELEAGTWDITSSMREIMFGLQRALDVASVWDLNRPALLHRPGGLDLRTPVGYATLEAAIRRAQPQLVVIGPLKYLSIPKPGENYEQSALNLMAVLNELMDRYQFALVLEAHFSRGDRGAPGGSERWVDWPDLGFGLHPPSDDITAHLGPGAEIEVKQFRIPRDPGVWVPRAFLRGADNVLPWSVKDYTDPYRYGGVTIWASRYGGLPQTEVGKVRYDQGEF